MIDTSVQCLHEPHENNRVRPPQNGDGIRQPETDPTRQSDKANAAPKAQTEHVSCRAYAVSGLKVDDVRRAAGYAFDARNSQRWGEVSGKLKALGQREIGANEERKRTLSYVANADRWSERRKLQSAPRDWWSAASELPWTKIALLVAVLMASILNGLYFLAHSGYEFSRGTLDMLAISSIFSLAPAILSKWMLTGLSDRSRHIVEGLLKVIALPVASGGLFIFAYVFGTAMEQVDLFADPAAHGFRIPIWILIGASMALECLASIGLVSGISADLRPLSAVELIENERYSKEKERLQAENTTLTEIAAERAQLEALSEAYKAERAMFIERCVTLFLAYQLQLQSEMLAIEARSRSEVAEVKQRFLQANTH